MQDDDKKLTHIKQNYDLKHLFGFDDLYPAMYNLYMLEGTTSKEASFDKNSSSEDNRFSLDKKIVLSFCTKDIAETKIAQIKESLKDKKIKFVLKKD